MLSLISLGRGLWQKFQTAHPVIRWGGAIIVGLVVLEFVAQEAISLYVHMQTARPTIEKANAEAATAEAQRQAATDCMPTSGYLKRKAEAMKAGLPIPPPPKCGP